MLGRRVKYHGKYATINVVLFLYHAFNLVWFIWNSSEEKKAAFISRLTTTNLNKFHRAFIRPMIHMTTSEIQPSTGRSALMSQSAGRHTRLNVGVPCCYQWELCCSVSLTVATMENFHKQGVCGAVTTEPAASAALPQTPSWHRTNRDLPPAQSHPLTWILSN